MGSPEFSGKSVLIVEDNALNAKLFAAVISALGLGVLQAEDGEAGFALAHEEQPDLIIMDVSLPGVSGLEVTRALKDDVATHDIPIIVTTAHAMSGEDAAIRASGCDGFMAKPIAVAELIAMVEQFLSSVDQPRYVRRLIEVNAEMESVA